MKEKKVAAVRGATRVNDNESDITAQVTALYDEICAANKLTEDEIISLMFTTTPDITARNPAAALRAGGRASSVALFTAQEPPFPPNHPRMIRVLLHCRIDADSAPRHVYRNGAEILRPDLAESHLN